MRYRLTPRASEDLEDIWRYSARTWSVDQAERHLETLFRTFDALVAMPKMARERREVSPPVRVHPSAGHVVIYRIERDGLLIIRVLDARRNWQGILAALDR